MMNKASQKTESGSNLTVGERSDLSPASKSGDGVVYPRRRQLLTGSVAGAGILLAMQAKTALGASICQSPSAMLSGNQSPRPGSGITCWGGHSPSYWKQPQYFGQWVGLIPPTFYQSAQVNSNCALGPSNKQVSPCDLSSRGTLLSSIFSGAPDVGAWEVLVWPTLYPGVTDLGTNQCKLSGVNSDVFGGKGLLLRTLVAAYLNAATTDYPIRTNQITDMWDAVKGGGVYYPSGNTGNGLNAAGVMSYIQGMYLEADNAPDGCGKN